ncbi:MULTISPECIES: DUF1634 domain-containing protein [Myroides]|uniref:DUF1634 domain-containing protein n=1 Tax=Myroides albus TaxID=2562892 RepID=A0A6I3LFW5_9FLAO|nr:MULTISPECIES: DUF1634 domain-containing protein [Myroides]MTG97063.1 DUF1634 domain-containing protein [Myroides albus]MVX36022.1 DUF1634 domain-containing protein [Myroides sp. LoEW2-1]UVD78514.1 DUF1634 domain-containing protein [Myroides albus]
MSTAKFNDSDLQSIIGNVLRYGVLLALTVAVIGGIIVMFTKSGNTVDFSTFIEKDDNIFNVINRIFAGVGHGDGESIIFLGILLLFITPALRLLLSLVSFFFEKDWLYVFISLIVIGIIVLSVTLGFSH